MLGVECDWRVVKWKLSGYFFPLGHQTGIDFRSISSEAFCPFKKKKEVELEFVILPEPCFMSGLAAD